MQRRGFLLLLLGLATAWISPEVEAAQRPVGSQGGPSWCGTHISGLAIAEARHRKFQRRLARERGIDLKLVVGTGPDGRVTEKDVEGFTTTPAQAAPAVVFGEPEAPPAEAQRVELSRMRQTIARVTVDSKQAAPHFYVTAEVDMTRAMSLRREVNDAISAEQRVSVESYDCANSVLIKKNLKTIATMLLRIDLSDHQKLLGTTKYPQNFRQFPPSSISLHPSPPNKHLTPRS